MVTSSFSLDTSVVNGAYKDHCSTCIATVEAGALEQRVSAPRAGCLLDSSWSLLVLSFVYDHSETGPEGSPATFAVYGQHGVYCMFIFV